MNNNPCHDIAGKLMPVVDLNSCGGKEDCIAACPYDVFKMLPITPEQKAQLTLKGKLKAFFFTNKAFVVTPAQCHACGLCVKACPEKAIKLTRYIT